MRWSEVAPRVWRLGALASATLSVNPESLRIALDALLENAVKYTDHTDAIEIRSRSVGDQLVIEVADEGAGIPAEALDRIFDRFGRADAARSRVDGGVGLGLTIVDAIAKAEGGRCTVESSPAGSTFLALAPELVAPGAGARRRSGSRDRLIVRCRGGAAPRDPVAVVVAERPWRVLG